MSNIAAKRAAARSVFLENLERIAENRMADFVSAVNLQRYVCFPRTCLLRRFCLIFFMAVCTCFLSDGMMQPEILAFTR